MSIPCDRAATFRGLIVEYALLRGTKTKSLGVSLTVNLEECREDDDNPDVWTPWSEYEMVAAGQVNVIKGDGTLNQRGIESLIKNAGWDGDFNSIANGTWQPTRCQVTTKEQDQQFGGGFRINYVNGYDDAPHGGGGGNVSPDELKSLSSQYGPQIRALAGSAKRNAAPAPSGGPKTPPKAAPKPATRPATPADINDELETDRKSPAEDIPFSWIGLMVTAGLSLCSSVC